MVTQLANKFSTFFGTPRFISVFSRTCSSTVFFFFFFPWLHSSA